MPCDRRLKAGQTISGRAEEVRTVVAKLSDALASGRVKAVVDKTRKAIAFVGLSDKDRDGVTDACAYRRIMAGGSALARAAIARAEALAGVRVDGKQMAVGVHSHDNGKTWHDHK